MRDDDDGNDKPNDDYSPIPCGLYSEYEVAILHRDTLRLRWRDEQGMNHIDRVMPLDLQTRNHCEYLIAKNSEGNTVEIRLDRIIQEQE